MVVLVSASGVSGGHVEPFFKYIIWWSLIRNNWRGEVDFLG